METALAKAAVLVSVLVREHGERTRTEEAAPRDRPTPGALLLRERSEADLAMVPLVLHDREYLVGIRPVARTIFRRREGVVKVKHMLPTRRNTLRGTFQCLGYTRRRCAPLAP